MGGWNASPTPSVPGSTLPSRKQHRCSVAAGRRSAEAITRFFSLPPEAVKTLAAFLWALDRCAGLDDSSVPGVRVLYVSPLKALVYDIERNLRAPLSGIAAAATRIGVELHRPSVAVRTGDTPPAERQRMQRHPSEILVTTPESLYLMLGSRARETLKSVETVIIDEIHSLVPSKRGAHLALSMERLSSLTGNDPQRIGLSATARPTELVAQFLGGEREVSIVDESRPPEIELSVVVPMADMERPPEAAVDPESSDETSVLAPPSSAPPSEAGVWPSIYERMLAEIDRHRSTLIFVNSRGLCERLGQRLNEIDEARRRRAAIEADENPDEIAEDRVGAHAPRKRLACQAQGNRGAAQVG